MSAAPRTAPASSSRSTSKAPTSPRGSSSHRLSYPRSGRTGGDGRRGVALRPHARAGPSGHQARQHPDRQRAASRSSPISGWPCEKQDVGKGPTLRRDTRLHESRTGPWRRASGRWPQRHLQPGRRLLRTADSDGDRSGAIRWPELMEQITSYRATSASPDRRHDPQGTGTDLPEGALEAGVGAVHRRPRTWPTTCGISLAEQAVGQQPARAMGRDCASLAPDQRSRHPRHCRQHRPGNSDLGPASPSRSCRRGCGRSTPTMPTSSWNCLPGPRDRDGLPDSIRFWKTRDRGDGRRQRHSRSA